MPPTLIIGESLPRIHELLHDHYFSTYYDHNNEVLVKIYQKMTRHILCRTLFRSNLQALQFCQHTTLYVKRVNMQVWLLFWSTWVPTTVLQVETVPSSYSITALYTVLAKPTCRKWNHDRVIVTFNQILNYGII